MMNLQKFRARGTQKQPTLVRQENSLEMLQIEAENIRKWQVQMEIKFKDKDKELSTSKQTIDSLRKSVVDAKLENDQSTKQLQEEMKLRESCMKKLQSTRQMCELVKDEFNRLEGTLATCKEVASKLREENNKKKMKIQKLTDDFTALTANTKDMAASWETEHAKLVSATQRQVNSACSERDSTMAELKRKSDEIEEMGTIIKNLQAEMAKGKKAHKELEHTKGELKNSIIKLLQTIGEMKTVNECTVNDLMCQLNSAIEISAEKGDTIRDLNEQFAFSKQKWQTYEIEIHDEIAQKEDAIAELSTKCDEMQIAKDSLTRELASSSNDNEALQNQINQLTIEVERIGVENKIHIQQLEKEFSTKMENCQKSHQTVLEGKEKEINELTTTTEQMRKDHAQLEQNLKSKKGALKTAEDLSRTKQQTIDKLEKENKKLTQKNEDLKSKADVAKQLESDLAKLKENSTCEAKKAKETSDECEHWEKKAQELVKTVEEAQQEIKTLKGEVKEKQGEIKNMKKIEKEQTKMKQEQEKMKDKISEMDSTLKEKETKIGELEEGLKTERKVNAEYKNDINIFRQHLKDTEKMLSDESDKIVLRNEEIEELKKNVNNLKYELKKSESDNDTLRVKIKKMELKECSFTSATFTRKRKLQSNNSQPAEVLQVNAEKAAAKAHHTQVGIKQEPKNQLPKDILFDFAEDLISEVSFGSAVVTDKTKRTPKSSTPKYIEQVEIKREQFKESYMPKYPQYTAPQPHYGTIDQKPKTQKLRKRSSNNTKKKAKQEKKDSKKDGSLDWFEADSIYAFHD